MQHLTAELRPFPPAALPSSSTVTVQVSQDCTACGACIVSCPSGALRPAPRRPLVLEATCTACWGCVEVCPRDAIDISITRPLSGTKLGRRHQDRA